MNDPNEKKRLRVLLIILGLGLLCLPPLLRLEGGSTAASGGVAPALALTRRLTAVQSQALEGLTPVKKIYRLPENDLVAPAPDKSAYGSSGESAQIDAVVADATELLDGEELLWNGDRPYNQEAGVHYYRDDSILTLLWQECRDNIEQGWNTICTFAEVYVADASQFRRKLACDEYGAGAHKFPTDMAVECNAVLASSADFYRFRPVGINVWQRSLYRCAGERVDTCWVDGKGNLLYTKAGEVPTEEDARRYIEEHDILFTLSFGPLMVENGENVVPAYYYLGEANERYSRACIAQLGERHYLLMMAKDFITVSAAADIMIDMGVQSCYALDGGQTATLVMDGQMLNPSVFGPCNGAQRVQSDIIYFATAIPEGERGN